MSTFPTRQVVALSGLSLVVAAAAMGLGGGGPSFSGGTGEQNDPYRIGTAEQLLSIGSDPGFLTRSFILVNDLDLDPNLAGGQVYASAPIASLSSLTGTFDGAGHVIRNLVIEAPDKDYIGLFGQVGTGGVVENIGLEDCRVKGSDYVGIVAGTSEGEVSGCYSTGNVEGTNYVGGLIGQAKGVVALCHSAAEAGGNTLVGGLVGRCEASVVGCCATGRVCGSLELGGLLGCSFGEVILSHATGPVYGGDEVGGLVGIQMGLVDECHAAGRVWGAYGVGGLAGSNLGYIERCWWAGDVECQTDVGGLVGSHFGTVSQCHTMGSAHGYEEVGGLVGYSEGDIESCYSFADAAGEDSVGGLVGRQFSGQVMTSYSVGRVEAVGVAGGLIGETYEGSTYLSYWDTGSSGQGTSAGGRGRTAAQMKAFSTYKGWGNEGAWVLREGLDYPRLAWEGGKGAAIVDQPQLYGGGSGTESDPFRICTSGQFIQMGYYAGDWDKHFLLESDVDLDGVDPNEVWTIGIPEAPFTGVFDGNDHVISNVGCIHPSESWVGLFGVVGLDQQDPNLPKAEVKNLKLNGVITAGRNRAGALVGLNRGEVSHCTVEGGSVTGSSEVGGLVGRNEGQIHACGSKGVMDSRDGVCIGGLSGSNAGEITQSYGEVSLSGGGSFTGGLVGSNWGLVQDSYAQGQVLATGSYVGGLVGSDEGGQTERCYAVCVIPGLRSYVGGLVGWDPEPNTVVASFWDTAVSSQLFSYGGTGKDTSQMRTRSTYLDDGWDFVWEATNGTGDIWMICEGKDYPRLKWEGQGRPCQ